MRDVTRRCSAGAMAAAALIAVVGAPDLHPARAESPPAVEISPVRIDLDLDARTFMTAVVVTNKGTRRQKAVLELHRLGHDLDGNPLLLPAKALRKRVGVSPRTIDVLPDGQYSATITGKHSGTQGLYLALTARPAGKAAAGDDPAPLATSYLYVRPPRPGPRSVEVTEVSVYPPPTDEPGPLTFYAAVDNTGAIDVDPAGEIRIVADGEVVGVAALTSQTILPGFGRRLGGTWDPPNDLEGELELRAKISNPGATGRGTIEVAGGRVTAATTLPDESSDGGTLKWAAAALVALVLSALLLVMRRGRRGKEPADLGW